MTVGAVVSIGEEVVGRHELGTVNGAFELLTGDVLGTAPNFSAVFRIVYPCWNSSGSLPVCGGWLIADSFTRLIDDVDVILSSTQAP